MKVQLKGLGKRFQFDWVLRGIDLELETPGQYAVRGPNGSGKSTFLKMLCGHLSPSEGKIQFFVQDQIIDPNKVYQHLTYAAPYIDLIEELTLEEAIDFHQRFKPLLAGLDRKKMITLLDFERSAKKQIRYFSSGMKQRLKLALAICSASDMVLLDEPTSNLDEQGIEWYRSLIDQYTPGRLLVIASNASVDFDFCNVQIPIIDYKQKGRRKKK